MRGIVTRSVAVFGLGLVALAGLLYYAANVDAKPPEVIRIRLTRHIPSNETVALTTSSLAVDFSEPVDHASAEAAFEIEPGVDGGFSWSGSIMTFTPAERLPLEASFTAQLGEGVRDLSGNAMASASGTFDFQTAGHPAVVASQPADGTEDVPPDTPIVLTFSTFMDTASVESAIRVDPLLSITPRWSGEQLTLEHEQPLAEGVTYTVTLEGTARDDTGTPLEAAYELTFATARSELGVETTVPAEGTEGISVMTPIAVVFDAALDPGSVTSDMISVEPQVSGTIEVIAPPGAAGHASNEARILRFEPAGSLEPNTTYEVTLAAGVVGTDSTRLVAPLTWRFTTGAPVASLSNQIVFLSDRAGTTNLWAMNPDGSAQRQVTAELSPVTDYAVAPDGNELVFGDGALLIEQQADGSGRRELTGEGVLEFDPSYSPDGRTIVFGRADATTGDGQGLFMRDAGGGAVRQVVLPTETFSSGTPTLTPSAVPSATPTVAPRLRAPRFSPDGAGLAFVDEAGRVGILDLAAERLVMAPFSAASPPAWLSDSSGVFVSGRPDPIPTAADATAPLPRLDPASVQSFGDAEIAALQIVRIDRDDGRVSATRFGTGALRPATGPALRVSYIEADPAVGDAGELRLAAGRFGAGEPVLTDDGALAADAAFAPEAARLLVERRPGILPVARNPEIWVARIASGDAELLTDNGFLPVWVP